MRRQRIHTVKAEDGGVAFFICQRRRSLRIAQIEQREVEVPREERRERTAVAVAEQKQARARLTHSRRSSIMKMRNDVFRYAGRVPGVSILMIISYGPLLFKAATGKVFTQKISHG